jgi:hypothetical protein
MTAAEPLGTVVTAGHATYRITTSPGPSERVMSVAIVTGDGRRLVQEHASWRPLAFGSGGGTSYLWSARDLVILPPDPSADLEVLRVDEDLLLVFRVASGWVLVCETSVRVTTGREQVARTEIGDVIERVRWAEDRLLVEDARGITTSVPVPPG